MHQNTSQKNQNSTFDDGEEDDSWAGIWDRNNPASVYSRVPNRFRQALDEIPNHVRLMDEEDLLKHFNTTATICEARLRFWDMFKQTQLRVRLSEVFVSRNTFYAMIENHYRLMWFLIPPTEIINSQTSVLERSLEVLRRFVSGDNMWIESVIEKQNKDGSVEIIRKKEINTKAIGEARKVMESMTDRLHGSVAMSLKIQGQHHHLHAPTPAQKLQTMDVTQILDAGGD